MTQFPPVQVPEPDFIAADVVVPATGAYGRVFDTCSNALAVVNLIFAAANIALPARQFVSDGAVAYDDVPPEQGESGLLAIEAMRFRPGAPGIPALMAVNANTPYSLEMQVHLLRRVPVVSDQGFAPEPEEVTASAGALLLDWGTLISGVFYGRAAGSYGDPGSIQGAPYRKIMVQEITQYGPAGGLSGLVATLVSELV